MVSYIAILGRELKLVANSYRYNATTPDHINLASDITSLEAEIAQLHLAQRDFESRAHNDDHDANVLLQMRTREQNALGAQGISSGPEWDRADMLAEEAQRRFADKKLAEDRQTTLGLVIPSKQEALEQYRGVARIYTQTEQNRQRYFTELLGGEAFKNGEPNLESECKWHATQ
jgi:hypothetical protein